MEELASRSGRQARRLGSERARAVRDPILTTKMNPPVLRSDIVARPRLVERLERDVRRPLTLISAPAGYGKSTLAAQWLESSSLAGVWLSLDDGDNDLRSFLSYFVAATRRHSAEACRATHELLGAAELPAPAVLANLLANELETLRRPFVLALDDYHRITNPAIHELLDQVLRHPPRPLHLAIVTRHDPPLRLTAMRAGGLAIEIREADLRFSAEETAAVFRDVTSVVLDADSLAKVAGDLEGWIVGLRLVCLALYNLRDPKAYRLAGPLVAVRFRAAGAPDPAYWRPAAEEVIAMQEADLIVVNGAGYERWLEDVSLPTSRLVDTTADSRGRLIALDAALTHSHGAEGDHEHTGTAFTTWLDPTLLIEQARAAAAALDRRWPEHAATFGQGLASLETDLEALDAELAAATAGAAEKPVVFSHPVYQYLEKRYALAGDSLHWEPGEAPDEARWAELQELLARRGARWMIWEAEPLAATAERLTAAGVRSAVVDPCATPPGEGDLLAVLRRNAGALRAVYGVARP